jgi:predicted alpha/beta hydrolase family esterase
MKTQVLVIHGGDTFATYEEYIQFLKDYKIDPARFGKKDWKASLGEKLGREFEVILPTMPNKFNAKYLEWKIWFEKLFPFLRDEIILAGHSFGGSFLAKYLSEEKFPRKIKATFLVSPPYDTDGERKVVEFVLPPSLALLENQGGEIFLYHSKDDEVVPFVELAKYQRALPKAHVTVFDDRGHINQESFPEIVEDIKNL